MEADDAELGLSLTKSGPALSGTKHNENEIYFFIGDPSGSIIAGCNIHNRIYYHLELKTRNTQANHLVNTRNLKIAMWPSFCLDMKLTQ